MHSVSRINSETMRCHHSQELSHYHVVVEFLNVVSHQRFQNMKPRQMI